MTWAVVAAKTRASGRTGAPVTVSCSGKPGGLSRWTLCVRPEADVAWFVPDARVRLLAGAGDHAGQVRVEPDPNGDHALGAVSGRGGRGATLRLDAARLPLVPLKAIGVEFDFSDDWLEVTLPKALGPKALGPEAPRPGATATPPAALPPTAGNVFRGFGSTGKHPHEDTIVRQRLNATKGAV